jgi:hypothetical protein
LKRWDQLTNAEKKLFIGLADVFAADWACSDHESEKMGKLDNTWSSMLPATDRPDRTWEVTAK